MKDIGNTKAQLTDEVRSLRQKIAELEARVTERKQAEGKLKESEENYRNLIETSPYTIFVHVDQKILFMNPAGLELLGAHNSSEIIGKSILDFTHPDYLEVIKRRQELLKKGDAPRNEYFKAIRLDGSVIDVEIAAARRMTYQGKSAILSTLHDVTDRLKAEERAEHLILVLRAIRNVNQLITKEKDRDKLLKGACDNLVETRGYSSAWIALLDESGKLVAHTESELGKSFLPMVEYLKRGQLPACGQRALKQSKAVVIEDPVSTCADCPLSSNYAGRSAAIVRLEYEGKVYGLLSVSAPRELATDVEELGLFYEVATDIAFALYNIELEEQRKQAEELIEKSRTQYRDIVNNSLLGMAVYVPGQPVVFTNKRMTEITGYSVEELESPDFNFMVLFTEEDQRLITANIKRRFTGEYIPPYESMLISKTGDRKWVLIYNINTEYEGESAIQVQLLDISERKQAEKELEKHREHLEELVKERTKELVDAQEKLVRSEKLAVLGQLAGGMGHELRNPLGAIKNAAYFLNMALEEPEPEVKETLDILEKEVATSERIISSLLGFARPKPPIRRKVDINEVIQEALYHVTVPKNVKVVTQPGESLPAILADPDQLGQAFSNIIVNGIQAMPEGGQLAVKSEASNQEWVTISFADTGVGIPKENLQKLFEPLFTTKAKGIGLGLAVTRTLVEGHSGTIKAQSKVGKGSTFTVRLPIGGEKEK